MTSSPPEWAYSRVTDPGRYATLAVAATALLDVLAATYEVEVVDGMPPGDGVPSTGRTLRPVTGAPIAIGVTALPGVELVAGAGTRWLLPHCGCDACDDEPYALLVELQEIVTAVVDGTFAETPGGGWSVPGRSAGPRGATPPALGRSWPAWTRRPPLWAPDPPTLET